MTPAGGPAGRPASGPRSKPPSLREERRLLREGHGLVAGMDEVGRGALAGPVTVGVVVVTEDVGTAPQGVRDSKLLTPEARERLVPKLRRWAPAWAVGHAEPEEVDRYGILAALRLAGRRALASLPVAPTCVLLDGSHDWLSRPPLTVPAARGVRAARQDEVLFDVSLAEAAAPEPQLGPPREPAPEVVLPVDPAVLTMVKADMRCAAVAAASVLAKVARDAIMVERSGAHPEYLWHENKGYSAPEHVEALRRFGPCAQHRRSWSLPGCGPARPDELDALDALDALDLAAGERAAGDAHAGARPAS